MKGCCIFVIVFIFVVNFALIGATDDNSKITGNVVFSQNPNVLQRVYSKSMPAIGKVDVYYSYDLFVPKVESISFSGSFDYEYPLYDDLRVRLDVSTNGFSDFFGNFIFDDYYYVGDYYAFDEFGDLMIYNVTRENIDETKMAYVDYNNQDLPMFSGTAFTVSPDGHMLTSAHVVTLLEEEVPGMKTNIKNNYLMYYYELYYNSLYNEDVSVSDYEKYLKDVLYLEENFEVRNLRISKIEVNFVDI
jgi:hypothetical protein